VGCGTGNWGQAFSYDPFGNITKAGQNGGTSFSVSYSTSTNQITTSGYTYDANGNLTADNGSHSYTWDAEGNLASLDGNNETYDALKRRVEQLKSSAYTEILYAPNGAKLALMSGQTVTKMFVPLPGGATAVYAGTTLSYYRHPDWLGSSRIASSNPQAQTPYYDGAYAPFGESYNESGTTDRSFTGQNQDFGAIQLFDFLYREHNSTQGRWISPDPAGLASVDPTLPQSWNRYAYVANDPLNLVDPFGLWTATPVYAVQPPPPFVSSGIPSPTIIVCDIITTDFFGGDDVNTCPPHDLQGGTLGGGHTGGGGQSGGGSEVSAPQSQAAPSNGPLSPQAQACENKIQGAVNSALNTNSTYLGPTVGPGMNSMGYRNGAYNFNFFAPGVTNPVAGSNGGSGRFPGSGLHIPLPGGADPTIMPWGYNAQAGGSYFTAHYDSANPTDDLVSFFQHIINDVILRRPHGC
jgi:RHS repeat-associated protein